MAFLSSEYCPPLNCAQVVRFPSEPRVMVYDCEESCDPRAVPGSWGVGRYNERRRWLYTDAHYGSVGDEQNHRHIHLGIDLSCPAGTPVYAFQDGVVVAALKIEQDQDYGHLLITRHQRVAADGGVEVFDVLLGHLGPSEWKRGDMFKKNDLLGSVGCEEENGGWIWTHVHVQVITLDATLTSYQDLSDNCEYTTHIPNGTTSLKMMEQDLARYPDPQLYVLGKLY